jgi:hypothetical protein
MSTIPRVAFDEAGHTGPNLLDDAQPVFVLASVLATPELAAVANGERELKFSSLRASPAGRTRIVEILNHPSFHPETYVVSGFHKRFLAVIKIVDLLYEPLAHAAGIDLYERGSNLAMANMLYAVLPQFLGPELFESLLASFVAMCREPSGQNIDRFYDVAEQAYVAASATDLKDELGALLTTRVVVEADLSAFHANSLDPAIPSFFMHASTWTARLQTVFDVIHDSSKPIRNEQLVLEAMMSTREQPKAIGYDRRKMQFPISATGISFKDSKSEPSIQLADIIAGSVFYVLKSSIADDDDGFAAELRTTRVFSGDWFPVWPTLKVSPSELDTDEPAPSADPIDHVGAYVSGRLGGIPPAGKRRKPTNPG